MTCAVLGYLALVAPAGAPRLGERATSALQGSATTAALTTTGEVTSQARHRGGGWRVVVPRLNLDVRVVPISSHAGTLVPPADPQVLGWWSSGARPGSDGGSALITGHTVHATDYGALADLDRLRAGDRVTVLTDLGRVRYVVTSNRDLSKDALADQAAVLFDQAGPARLVLVTCTRWRQGVYRGNTVVTAVPL